MGGNQRSSTLRHFCCVCTNSTSSHFAFARNTASACQIRTTHHKKVTVPPPPPASVPPIPPIFRPQERQASGHDAEIAGQPDARDDRPIGGKRSAQTAGNGNDPSVDAGVDSGGMEAVIAPSADAMSSGPGAERATTDGGLDDHVGPAAAAGAGLKPWQRRKRPPISRKPAPEVGPPGDDGPESDVAAPPAKPLLKKKTAVVRKASPAARGLTAEVPENAVLGDGRDADGGVEDGPVKPWLRKQKPGGVKAAAPTSGGEGGELGAGGSGEEGSVAELEASLEERDWKKRVAAFEVGRRPYFRGANGIYYGRIQLLFFRAAWWCFQADESDP